MNPFNEIIEAMREEGKHYNEPSFYFAKVTSSYPNLKVKFDDIELDKNMLLVSSNIDLNSLKADNRVVMIRDLEKFIIISKVVSI